MAAERDFHHPYEPYAIQTQFMNAVYQCLEDGKVGIFESPTGTGKSLSLICGSLTWLRDNKRRVFDEGLNVTADDDDEPDWITAHAREQRRSAALQRRADEEARLAKVREMEKRARARYETGEPLQKRRKVSADTTASDDDNEASFLLEDYESEEEGERGNKRNAPATEVVLSAETKALMEKLGMSIGKEKIADEIEAIDELKIFFCSRTHSQITQFVNELRRVKLAPAIPGSEKSSSVKDKSAETEIAEELKHLTLGSRKNLCINPKVSKLGSTTAINERCLEIQQPGVSTALKCPYVPSKDNEVLVNDFRDHALARIRDIEDFGRLGKQLGICPYYASRAATRPMEIITLPYPLLLQKSAREALGLSLKNHVVIIDEAHNLIDAIANIHSVSISFARLNLARAQLTGYLQKFRNRLKGKNRVYVTQLVRLLDSLMVYLQGKADLLSPEGQVQIGDLMAGKGVDQINLYKLMRYLQESKLARKVERYAVHTEVENAKALPRDKDPKKATTNSSSMPVLTQVQSFLLALTSPAAEGRFFYKKLDADAGRVDVQLDYMLLDPTHNFKEIVDEARAVILAGGTMSPMSDYTDHLFHYLPLERIESLSCGHVIPRTNLFAAPVAKGPNGTEFDFTYGKRNSVDMIHELGLAILEFTRTIPDGLVIFFPSYAYLDSTVRTWQQIPPHTGPTKTSLWTLLSSRKRIYLEPRSTSTPLAPSPPAAERPNLNTTPTSSSVDKVLADYTAHINTGAGALLLAVIGGSLSEGINFSDRLGRGIVVVGLPFPNAQSPAWKAKLEFVEQRSRGQRGAAGEFLENTCMRAVNQSVGRAIRHKGDWAAILLLDRRYGQERVWGKLPGWIRESLVVGRAFGGVMGGLKEFFAGKV